MARRHSGRVGSRLAASAHERSGTRRGVLAAVVAAAALVLSACGGSGSGSGSSASGDITLGISVPLSGAVGSSCAPMNKAMLAWFDHVNAQGGINGHKIKVDNRDDGYDAARAVTNTKAFIAEKVAAVTGQCGSLQPPAQLPLLNAAKIPFMYVFGASTTLLKPLSPMYFNLMPTYGSQLVAEIPWVFQQHGPGTVALMSTVTPDSPTTAKQVEAAVKQAGGTFVGDYTAPPGTADFSPQVLKMKQKHPDYVVLDQIPQDAARLTQAMTDNGFAPNKFLVGSSAVSQQTFLAGVSAALQPKLLVASDTIAPASAEGTDCVTVLNAAKIKVEGVTLRGCGTAQVVESVLKAAKQPVSSQSVVAAMESMAQVKASEIYPPVSFSATNHVGVSDLYVFGVKNGAFYQAGSIGG
ncbi:ABC transporter substrate-binding protein [Actinacidiphila epipremni]|uniref:ABC transporter substrate-binding protein n=1 Tax=Actinacidiphila epipremni TaxID=2053013 RepID=A0ABX0ZYZ7_9ACTN|nr:ABC transporter substrate-binding protein [Actinacidiphila epipremni]NJP46828.1 ABC transporter substrate-binding protein [Actinacidiphila epipremni]